MTATPIRDAGPNGTGIAPDLLPRVFDLFVQGYRSPGRRQARIDVKVAILDIGLPEMDGYALAAAMRGRLGASIRLIAVTGYAPDQDRTRAQQAGFDAHFAEPVSLAQLVADIELARGASPKR
jgi:CheY-like chemotaxis protein